jgi:hypothetical protein
MIGQQRAARCLPLDHCRRLPRCQGLSGLRHVLRSDRAACRDRAARFFMWPPRRARAVGRVPGRRCSTPLGNSAACLLGQGGDGHGPRLIESITPQLRDIVRDTRIARTAKPLTTQIEIPAARRAPSLFTGAGCSGEVLHTQALWLASAYSPSTAGQHLAVSARARAARVAAPAQRRRIPASPLSRTAASTFAPRAHRAHRN